MKKKKGLVQEQSSPDIASKSTFATLNIIAFSKCGVRDATDEEEK
jgi:hypothetical protein